MIMISQIASKGDSHIHIVFLQVRSTCNNFDTDQSNTKMTDANPDPSKKNILFVYSLKLQILNDYHNFDNDKPTKRRGSGQFLFMTTLF